MSEAKPESSEANPESPPANQAADQIRTAAKWFIGAFGAIGAAVVTGIAFGDIGKLEGSDLEIAITGIVVAFVGIIAAVVAVTRLLIPVGRELSELKDASEKDPAIRRFNKAPNLLTPFQTVDELYTARIDALAAYRAAYLAWADIQNATTTRVVKAAETRCKPIEAVAERVISWGNYASLQTRFQHSLWRFMVPGIALAVGGLGLFAIYVKDPPSSSPASLNGVQLKSGKLTEADLSGVNLKTADLTNADLSRANLSDAVLAKAVLDGANLTAANLEGASLEGASLKDAVWAHTTCPDGKNSDDVGNTCSAHLKSKSSDSSSASEQAK